MSPLFDTLNQSRFCFYFLVVDEFLDIKLPELNNFTSLSPQSLGITLREKNSGQLLSHPKTIEYIQKNTPSHLTPAIIPFKPSTKIELVCQKNNWQLIANPTKLNRLFEDKIKFTQICQDNTLPQIPSLTFALNPDNFTQAEAQLGSPLVLQTHFGWAGNSTHQASTYSEAITKIAPNTIVKFSPLLQGYSLLNNCCLTSSGLIQSPPALQYTGIPLLTTNPFATTGRQWPSFAPANIQEQVNEITSRFSYILQQQNFRGFFGLDFFVQHDKVYLLECNPRLTASFAFYTEIEIKNNQNPLFLFHLVEFLNIKIEQNINREQGRFYNQNLIGSEITKKDNQGKTIGKYHDFKIFSSSTSPVNIPVDIIEKVS